MVATRSRAGGSHARVVDNADSDGGLTGNAISSAAGPSRLTRRLQQSVASDDEEEGLNNAPPAHSKGRLSPVGSRKTKQINGLLHSSVSSDSQGSSDAANSQTNLEGILKQALKGTSDLQNEIAFLKENNANLLAELQTIRDAQDVELQPRRGRRAGASTQVMQTQLRKLTFEVAELKKAREKDRKKIKKLKLKEIQHDAAELQDELVNGVVDKPEKMRKLLKRFYSLVTSPSLEENEECVVCMETLKPLNCISLPCQHICCSECVPNISPPNCPVCRGPFATDGSDSERVNFTATQQWDELLVVAREWASLDKHGADSEPEETEEEEEPFIDDEDPDASIAASEGTEHDDGDGNAAEFEEGRIESQTHRDNPDSDSDGSPSAGTTNPNPLSYDQSPRSEKRKRLKSLVDLRRLKKSRTLF